MATNRDRLLDCDDADDEGDGDGLLCRWTYNGISRVHLSFTGSIGSTLECFIKVYHNQSDILRTSQLQTLNPVLNDRDS